MSIIQNPQKLKNKVGTVISPASEETMLDIRDFIGNNNIVPYEAGTLKYWLRDISENRRNSYRMVSAASSTNVLAQAGTLHSITFNSSCAAYDGATTTVYDSVAHTAGNEIAKYFGVNNAPCTVILDIAVSAGITVSCVSANNITVTYDF